jgi:hypothetical protein
MSNNIFEKINNDILNIQKNKNKINNFIFPFLIIILLILFIFKEDKNHN